MFSLTKWQSLNVSDLLSVTSPNFKFIEFIEYNDNYGKTRLICSSEAVADPGFTRRRGVPIPEGGTNLLFGHFFPKTAWIWRIFGPEESLCSLRPLDPPVWSHWSWKGHMCVNNFIPISITRNPVVAKRVTAETTPSERLLRSIQTKWLHPYHCNTGRMSYINILPVYVIFLKVHSHCTGVGPRQVLGTTLAQ